MSKNGLTFIDLRNAILFGALVYLSIVFIRDIADVILIFSIIALVIVTFDPFISYAQKHGIPRGVTTALLALMFIGFVGLMLYFILPIAAKQLTQFVSDIPALTRNIREYTGNLRSRYPGFLTDIPKFNFQTLSQISRPLLGGVSAVTTRTLYTLAASIVIFVGSIYGLVRPQPLVDGLLRAVRPEHRNRARLAGARLAAQIRAWGLGVIGAMLIIFALTWIALYFLGIKQALLFAIIAGLLEIVPVIGPILSAVPPMIVALASDPLLALWVAVAFTVIQQAENHLIIPLVMSRQVSLHPVTIIFWVLVMGALYGIIGIFLATPAAVTFGVLYDELYLCEYESRCDEAAHKNHPEEKPEENAS